MRLTKSGLTSTMYGRGRGHGRTRGIFHFLQHVKVIAICRARISNSALTVNSGNSSILLFRLRVNCTSQVTISINNYRSVLITRRYNIITFVTRHLHLKRGAVISVDRPRVIRHTSVRVVSSNCRRSWSSGRPSGSFCFRTPENLEDLRTQSWGCRSRCRLPNGHVHTVRPILHGGRLQRGRSLSCHQ